MDKYWQMKKLMAPGCEPEFVTRLMTSLRPHALGMCMAGAGGGGFMYVLARDHESQKNIKNMIGNMEVSEHLVFCYFRLNSHACCMFIDCSVLALDIGLLLQFSNLH